MKKIKITESQLNKLMKEQAIKKLGDKIKAGGDKIKAGVQNVVNKVTGSGAQPVAASPQTAPGRNLDELKAEWSKVNQDMSNMRGYGEAVGQTESSAKTAAMLNAKAAILKKLGKSSARFGSEIKEEALFKLENGNLIKLVVLELTKVWEDETNLKLNEDISRIKSVMSEVTFR